MGVEPPPAVFQTPNIVRLGRGSVIGLLVQHTYDITSHFFLNWQSPVANKSRQLRVAFSVANAAKKSFFLALPNETKDLQWDPYAKALDAISGY